MTFQMTLPGLPDIEQARASLQDVLVRTPVLPLDPAVAGGRDLLVKCENLQRTGSFKIRGAYNRIAELTPEQRARGVVAYSSGNHAQGVAYAAALLGMPAAVVMIAYAIASNLADTHCTSYAVIIAQPHS